MRFLLVTSALLLAACASQAESGNLPSSASASDSDPPATHDDPSPPDDAAGCVKADLATTADTAECRESFCRAGDATYDLTTGKAALDVGGEPGLVWATEVTDQMNLVLKLTTTSPVCASVGTLAPEDVSAVGVVSWLGQGAAASLADAQVDAVSYDGARFTATLRIVVSKLGRTGAWHDAEGCYEEEEGPTGCTCTFEAFEPFTLTFNVDVPTKGCT